MAVEAGRAPLTAAPRQHVSRWSRVYGFGSVYAKTLRDSRLAFIIIAGLLGGFMLVAGAAVGTGFATAALRQEMANLATDLPPILQRITHSEFHLLQNRHGIFGPWIVGS